MKVKLLSDPECKKMIEALGARLQYATVVIGEHEFRAILRDPCDATHWYETECVLSIEQLEAALSSDSKGLRKRGEST